MRYVKIFAIVILFCGGCKEKSQLPSCWLGKSTKEFDGKTMVSMVWIRPTPGGNPLSKDINSAYQVYKRFDGADYKILLNCMSHPERSMSAQNIYEEFLYLSFLDGTRYIVDFGIRDENQSILIRNGSSKILYKLLVEKEPCPAYNPRMDAQTDLKDPNEIRGCPAI